MRRTKPTLALPNIIPSILDVSRYSPRRLETLIGKDLRGQHALKELVAKGARREMLLCLLEVARRDYGLRQVNRDSLTAMAARFRRCTKDLLALHREPSLAPWIRLISHALDHDWAKHELQIQSRLATLAEQLDAVAKVYNLDGRIRPLYNARLAQLMISLHRWTGHWQDENLSALLTVVLPRPRVVEPEALKQWRRENAALLRYVTDVVEYALERAQRQGKLSHPEIIN